MAGGGLANLGTWVAGLVGAGPPTPGMTSSWPMMRALGSLSWFVAAIVSADTPYRRAMAISDSPGPTTCTAPLTREM